MSAVNIHAALRACKTWCCALFWGAGCGIMMLHLSLFATGVFLGWSRPGEEWALCALFLATVAVVVAMIVVPRPCAARWHVYFAGLFALAALLVSPATVSAATWFVSRKVPGVSIAAVAVAAVIACGLGGALAGFLLGHWCHLLASDPAQRRELHPMRLLGLALRRIGLAIGSLLALPPRDETPPRDLPNASRRGPGETPPR